MLSKFSKNKSFLISFHLQINPLSLTCTHSPISSLNKQNGPSHLCITIKHDGLGRRFNEDKSLSDTTILFMFSDHGPRYTKLRKSIKGLLHERNPFFSIYIPKLFKQRYPNEFVSLKRNLDTVLAPMDIYATLIKYY